MYFISVSINTVFPNFVVIISAHWNECGRVDGLQKDWTEATWDEVMSTCPTDKSWRFECGDLNGRKYTSRMINPMNLTVTECVKFEGGSLWQASNKETAILDLDSSDPGCNSPTGTQDGKGDLYMHFTSQFNCAGIPNVQRQSGWWFSVSYFDGNFL